MRAKIPEMMKYSHEGITPPQIAKFALLDPSIDLCRLLSLTI